MTTVSLKQAYWAFLYCLNMLGNIDLVEFIKDVPHFYLKFLLGVALSGLIY
jgi:hypothetical protein